MLETKYRYLVPNFITFFSLGCGVVAIMLSGIGHFRPAAYLILASYILDLFDGAMARRLNASSEFGLQLDSLVDMVSLGTAPAMLMFMYLQSKPLPRWSVWVAVVFFAMAGAYRLARFNLLPPKSSGSGDSVGLTISTGGASLALTVLADSMPTRDIIPLVLPTWFFVPFVVLIGILMVSRVPYPSFFWVFGRGRRSLPNFALIAVALVFWPFFQAWFVLNLVYLAMGLYRGWQQVRGKLV